MKDDPEFSSEASPDGGSNSGVERGVVGKHKAKLYLCQQKTNENRETFRSTTLNSSEETRTVKNDPKLAFEASQDGDPNSGNETETVAKNEANLHQHQQKTRDSSGGKDFRSTTFNSGEKKRRLKDDPEISSDASQDGNSEDDRRAVGKYKAKLYQYEAKTYDDGKNVRSTPSNRNEVSSSAPSHPSGAATVSSASKKPSTGDTSRSESFIKSLVRASIQLSISSYSSIQPLTQLSTVIFFICLLFVMVTCSMIVYSCGLKTCGCNETGGE